MADNALLKALLAIPETAGNMAGNMFFDVGATGAEALQDPSMLVKAMLGNREQGAQFQQNRQARRDQLPNFAPSQPTAQVQQGLADKVTPLVQALAQKYPNEAQFAMDYMSDPSVQSTFQAMETFGLPAMRMGKGLQGAIKSSMNAPSHMDEMVGALMAQNAPGADVAQAAYHGSPHKFDRFSMDKIGTGEGAQAYGHGLYFADDPKVAGQYRNQLANNPASYDYRAKIDTTGLPNDSGVISRPALGMREAFTKAYDSEAAGEFADRLFGQFTIAPDKPMSELVEITKGLDLTHGGVSDEVAADIVRRIELPDSGHTYEVDIPDEQIDRMLDWDKPLSEQPESVQNKLVTAIKGMDERGEIDYFEDLPLAAVLGKHPRDKSHIPTGQEIYNSLSDIDLGGNPAGSELASTSLHSLGIPGIKYLDGTSRSAGEGTRNFVVFDENSVKTLSRNGEPVLPLDEASRKWYHGTDEDITGFSDEISDTVHFTEDAEDAKFWGKNVIEATPQPKNARTITAPEGIDPVEYWDNIQGADEWLDHDAIIVKSKGFPSMMVAKTDTLNQLPLDEASRMARAKEMGFDTDVYHGTRADIDEFEPGDIGIHVGSADTANVRLTDTEAMRQGKNRYATRNKDYGEDANVLALKAKAKNPLRMQDVGEWRDPSEVSKGIIESDLLARNPGLRKEVEEIQEQAWQWRDMGDYDDYLADPEVMELNARLSEIIGEGGHDSVVYNNFIESRTGGEDSLIILDPKNIRSVNAKFDPSKKDSANLMAGAAGGGLVAALMAQQNDRQQ